jgi:2-amino-4-hydroxy-6-hydroxymethyldihydropteridine diphosphokinase
MNNSVLLLGSNMGNRLQLINQAKKKIAEQIGDIILNSAIYETAAWGKTEQNSFYNCVCSVQTLLTPEQLLHTILNIESELGRKRTKKWAPRFIDIDILYYNTLVFETEELTIPHPLLHFRKFTLIPLVEILPNYIHPKLNCSNANLLAQCSDNLSVSTMPITFEN